MLWYYWNVPVNGIIMRPVWKVFPFLFVGLLLWLSKMPTTHFWCFSVSKYVKCSAPNWSNCCKYVSANVMLLYVLFFAVFYSSIELWRPYDQFCCFHVRHGHNKLNWIVQLMVRYLAGQAIGIMWCILQAYAQSSKKLNFLINLSKSGFRLYQINTFWHFWQVTVVRLYAMVYDSDIPVG